MHLVRLLPLHSPFWRQFPFAASSNESGMLFAMPLDEFLQIFAGFRDVLPQSGGGPLRVLGFAYIQKLPVGLARTVLVTRKYQMQAGIAVAITVQRFEKRQHHRPIGRSIQRGMKAPIPAAPGLYLLIVFQRFFVVLQNIFGNLEIFRLHVRDSAAEHVALQDRASLKHLLNFVGRQSGDNRAAIRHNGD